MGWQNNSRGACYNDRRCSRLPAAPGAPAACQRGLLIAGRRHVVTTAAAPGSSNRAPSPPPPVLLVPQSEPGYLTPPPARRLQSLSGHEESFQACKRQRMHCQHLSWHPADLLVPARTAISLHRPCTCCTNACPTPHRAQHTASLAQVDSFTRAAARGSAAGKLTALLRSKLSLARGSPAPGASGGGAGAIGTATRSPGSSAGGTGAPPACADDLLQWSNVRRAAAAAAVARTSAGCCCC